MEGVEPKVEAEIRRCVADIAERRYPRVWVGKAGITTEELLHLQQINEEVPDWLRIEPGGTPSRSTEWSSAAWCPMSLWTG